MATVIEIQPCQACVLRMMPDPNEDRLAAQARLDGLAAGGIPALLELLCDKCSARIQTAHAVAHSVPIGPDAG